MRSILLIEDDPFTRSLAVRTLAATEVTILEAENGQQGIELALEHQPALILCDIELPRLGGFDVLTALRADPRTRHVPFIFLTAHGEREDMRRGMDLGADDYITKPFTAEELRTAVATRLAKHDEALRERDRALEEMRRAILQTFPHELRTPLNVIMGACELLKEESGSTGENRKALLDKIETAAERLHRMAENFLIFSRACESKCHSNSVPVCPHRLTRPGEVISIRARQVAVRFNRPRDLHLKVENTPVRVSAEDLDKIVEELVRNAVTYSKRGTAVHVTARREGPSYLVLIADSGRGMKPQDIASVAPFRQFDRSVYEQQGVGLGLAIASRLAERHGGGVNIASTPGVGTTVTVSFLCGDD